MEEIIMFILGFIFIFLVYQVIIVMPAKKSKNEKGRKKKKDRDPVEVKYLISRYKLDMEKINYNQLLQIVAITSSFDISVVAGLILIIENFFLAVIIGFVSIIILIAISYHLVYLFYKKKGMIKND